MATLTNTKIKDTYDGLLKTTNNEAIAASGVTLIEDGLGNASALSVGRSGNGVTITGSLNATLATAAQPNITSVGTLSSLAVSGNLTVDTNTLFVDASSDSVSINDNVTANVPLTVTTNSGYEDVLYLKSSGTNIDSRISMFPTGTGNAVINAATNSLEFQIGGSERMRIDSSGNVGIGESNPSAYSSVAANNLVIGNASGNKGLTISSGTTGFGNIAFADGTGATDQYRGLIQYGHTANSMNFFTNATERMRIDSSGNVGIGTSSPSVPLEINGGTANNVIKVVSTDTAVAIQFEDVNTTQGVTVGTVGNDMRFITGSTERMRITSGGDVLFGTTTDPFVTNNGGSGFFVASNGRMIERLATTTTAAATLTNYINPNGIVGSISVTGSSTAFNTSSDYRLKENVVPMEGALDRVDALNPSRFNFIADADKTVDGFLAHEVAEVVPEAVTGEKDAVDEEGNPIYQGIDQSKIVPLLVGAIKELSAKVAALESQLNA